MMTRSTIHSAPGIIGLLACGALLSGCGEVPEDVRLGFCRALVRTQVPAQTSVVWTGAAIKQGVGDLLIRLRFETPSAREAVCAYPYRAVDDTALTLVDPLAAYGTSPTSLTLDGRALSRAALATAIKEAMVLQVRSLTSQRGDEK